MATQDYGLLNSSPPMFEDTERLQGNKRKVALTDTDVNLTTSLQQSCNANSLDRKLIYLARMLAPQLAGNFSDEEFAEQDSKGAGTMGPTIKRTKSRG